MGFRDRGISAVFSHSTTVPYQPIVSASPPAIGHHRTRTAHPSTDHPSSSARFHGVSRELVPTGSVSAPAVASL